MSHRKATEGRQREVSWLLIPPDAGQTGALLRIQISLTNHARVIRLGGEIQVCNYDLVNRAGEDGPDGLELVIDLDNMHEIPVQPGSCRTETPMRLVLISDTHLPTRAKDLPAQVWREIDACDAVIHAGDWMESALLDRLEQRARVIGVYGNNDGADLRARLPEIARVELDGLQFAVIHETGSKQARETRMDQMFPNTDVLVFGHSHIPWDTMTPSGMRLLNPGSPTDRRAQPHCTYMTATVASGELVLVELHNL